MENCIVLCGNSIEDILNGLEAMNAAIKTGAKMGVGGSSPAEVVAAVEGLLGVVNNAPKHCAEFDEYANPCADPWADGAPYTGRWAKPSDYWGDDDEEDEDLWCDDEDEDPWSFTMMGWNP